MAVENKMVLPWYKHRFVWLIIAIPFSAVIMGIIMIWLAVESNDGLVADDYYKKGLEINRSLERDVEADELLLGARLEIDNRAGLVNLYFDKGKLEHLPATARLKLQFATKDASDMEIELLRGQKNQYIGHLGKRLSKGKWYLELSDGSWRLNSHAVIDSDDSLEISF